MDKQSLGKIISEQRNKFEMSQKQLATMLNTTEENVIKWENDEVVPNRDTLKRISEIFSIPLSALTDEKTLDQQVTGYFKDKSTMHLIILGLHASAILLYFFPFVKVEIGGFLSGVTLAKITGFQTMFSIFNNFSFGGFIISLLLMALLGLIIIQTIQFVTKGTEYLIDNQLTLVTLAASALVWVVAGLFALLDKNLKLALTPIFMIAVLFAIRYLIQSSKN